MAMYFLKPHAKLWFFSALHIVTVIDISQLGYLKEDLERKANEVMLHVTATFLPLGSHTKDILIKSEKITNPLVKQ